MRKPAIACLLAALLLAGCGTKAPSNSPSAAAEPKVRDDGSLAVDPAPLTLDDVDAQPEGSPERLITELWFWAQWGSAPNIVALYDPEVRESLGIEAIAGAYAMQRSSMVTSQLKVTKVRRTDIGTTVLVQMRLRGAPPRLHSFVLRRRGEHWRVVHDTLLEDAVAGYAQVAADEDPRDDAPTAAAFKRGLEASSDYRRVYIAAEFEARARRRAAADEEREQRREDEAQEAAPPAAEPSAP